MKVEQKTVYLYNSVVSWNYFSYGDRIGEELRAGWILKFNFLDSERIGTLVFERAVV